MKEPCVYLLANFRNGALYVGVTSDLLMRLAQHRDETFGGHTKRYGIKMLVWFERHDTMESAILFEKKLKKWKREWKLALIEKDNPDWLDLAENFGFDPLP